MTMQQAQQVWITETAPLITQRSVEHEIDQAIIRAMQRLVSQWGVATIVMITTTATAAAIYVTIVAHVPLPTPGG